MKPSTGTLALGLLLSVGAPSASALATDPGEQLLLERADYWRAQQRLDLAAATLAKVLALNSRQADALYQSGVLAAERHSTVEAQLYFDRLRQVARDDPHAAELAKAVPQPGEATPVPPPASALPVAAPASTAAVPMEVATVAPVVKPNAEKPASPQLAAVSADSDDLVSAPPAPPAPAPRRVIPSPAAGGMARGKALAVATAVTVSDGDTALPPPTPAAPATGSADLGQKARAVQLAQAELMPPPPIGGYLRPISGVSTYSPDDTLDIMINRSEALLEAQTNPSLLAGLGVRAHGGSSGTTELTELGVPIEATFSPWLTGTARFAVVPVYLDAGSVATSNLSSFGANPILNGFGVPMIASGHQTATGVGLLGSYTYGDFSGQLGTTPLGFTVTNVIGDIAYSPKFLGDQLTLRLEGLRQPVNDSVLSYAGTHASLAQANALTGGAFGTSNGTWGGVVKTGGHATVFYDNGFTGAYGGAGLASLTGTNVAQNSVVDALAGTYFRPWKTDDWAIRVGIALYYMGYDKNLGGYTFGQGGYFSPQNFESLTFPVEYTGYSGRWSYLVGAAVGVQHFNSDSSPIFPNNAAAQAALIALHDTPTTFSGTSTTGPGFNLRGQIEYAIDDSLRIGAAANLDNGKSYTEGVGKIYLRKTFDWFGPSTAGSDPASIVQRDLPQSHL